MKHVAASIEITGTTVSVGYSINVDKIGKTFVCEAMGFGVIFVTNDETKIFERSKKAVRAFIDDLIEKGQTVLISTLENRGFSISTETKNECAPSREEIIEIPVNLLDSFAQSSTYSYCVA